MSVIVPINELDDQHELMNYIFEISENVPDDFYITIMNLMKIFYDEHGENIHNINEYLHKNKNKINNVILIKISSLLPPQPPEQKRTNNLNICIFIQNAVHCFVTLIRNWYPVLLFIFIFSFFCIIIVITILHTYKQH